jgi:16S rRNA (guanine527-N7)-methyltransferase
MTPARMRTLLFPYLPQVSTLITKQLCDYLALLMRWNRVTNLTAIRDEEAVVRRHFGESLFAASLLPTGQGTLLDIGSGAGFPGIPIALERLDLHVTLAESQGKKAAFLQEVVRTLDLENVEVFTGRVEQLQLLQQFDIVTARAVDRPADAREQMLRRTRAGGLMVNLCGIKDAMAGSRLEAIPESEARVVEMRVKG